jgi:hypothetical protein
MVQSHAMRAWKEGLNFRELVEADPAITKRVPAQAIKQAFDIKRQLRNIDGIFARIFKGTKTLQSNSAKSVHPKAFIKNQKTSQVS